MVWAGVLRSLPLALLPALLLAAAPTVLAAQGPWQENEQSRVRLISPWQVAPGSGEWVLGLEFETIPGWHVYWKNSGDAGYPPAIDYSATPGIAGSEILWPAPERYHLPGDLVALGYEGQVVYPLRIVLADETPAARRTAPLAITADLDYLVCEVDCIPYSYELSLAQPLAAVGEPAVEDSASAAVLATWQARVPRPAEEVDGLVSDGYLDLREPQSPRLQVRFAGLTLAQGAQPELFLEASEVFDIGVPERVGRPEAGNARELHFQVPLTFRQRPEARPTAADFAWTLTGATTGASEAGAIEARRSVPAGTSPPAQVGGSGERRAPFGAPGAPGLPATLLWAFLGGLLLHLTPTVLPLSLLRLASLSREAAPVRGAALTAAGLTAGALGFAVWAAADPATTWGSQLQAPLPVAALTLVATLVALHLWGLLRLPLATGVNATADATTSSPRAAGGSNPSSLAAAFLTGLALVALALAWDLPPLARSLGPAFGGPGAGGSALLAAVAALALAAGLALPFLLVATLPALRSALASLAPGTPLGRRLAEALGFLEAGAVLWLLYLLSRQVTVEGIAYVQLTLLALAMVAWLRHTARRPAMAAILAVTLIALSAAVLWLAVDQRLHTFTSARQTIIQGD